jgi:hypothetical protein
MGLNKGNKDTESEATKKVCWSFAVRSVVSTPKEPLAPGLLSTKTACPSRFLTLSPTSLATTSFEPPAGNGTTKLMGLLGQSCANADGCASATPSAVATRPLLKFRLLRIGMRLPIH